MSQNTTNKRAWRNNNLIQNNKQSVPSASKNEASTNKRGKTSNPR